MRNGFRLMDFNCIQDCSQCCIEREYYPSKKFGKVGVLILPEEKNGIEELARKNKIEISIIPRIGVSQEKSNQPEKILAFQMMGKEKNGNTCPFLDTESGKKSPHGGFPCKIYEDRPLACKAYPVIGSDPIQMDSKCKFCKEHGSTEKNLNSELEALVKIKTKMTPSEPYVWRYATAIGEDEDKDEFQSGWIMEE